MALKFQLRGTSKTAWHANALQAGSVLNGSESQMPVVSSGISGVFGGSLIDMRNALPLAYIGADIWAVGTKAFTVLLRIVPTWSGTPTNNQGIFYVGPANLIDEPYDGLRWQLANYAVTLVRINDVNGTAIYNDQLYNTFPSFVANAPIDLWLAWDGTSNPIELWQGLNGQVPTRLCANSPYATAVANRVRNVATSLIVGRPDVNDSSASDYYLNELVIWDQYMNPTSFGARTNFISAPQLEGYDYSDPGAINVAAGVSYQFGGVTEVGTLTSITNEYVAPTLVVTGQSLNATLEET